MMYCKRALRVILPLEGKYSDDPDDPGNWTGGKPGSGELKGTKYGVSAKAYPDLDILNLTYDDVASIYYDDYWLQVHADEIGWPFSLYLMDAAINQGVIPAIRMMQEVLRVESDGLIGPITRKAMVQATRWHATQYLTARAFRYMETRNFDKYGRGWFNRLVQLAENQNAHKG